MATTEDDVVVRLRLKDVARFIAEVRAGTISIDELEKKISKAGRTAAKESSSSGGGFGMFASLMKHMAFAVPFALGGMATATAGFAIKSAADLEQVHVGFETMLGSAGAANKMIRSLQDFAEHTPFRLSGVEDATQKLLGMGFQAKNILPTLTAIGDAAAGLRLGEGDIQGLVLTLGQVQTKGVMRSDEIMQFNERGINAKKYLGKALGMNPVELQKALDAGKVSSDKAIPIILKGMERDFAGLAAKESKTLGGVWSNLLDATQRGLSDIVGPYVPAMTKWLQQVIDHIPQYKALLTRIVASVVRGAKAGIQFAQSLFDWGKGIYARASDAVSGFIQVVKSALDAGDWTPIGGAVGTALRTVLMTALGGAAGGTGGIDWVGVGKAVVPRALELILGLVTALLDPVMWFNFIKDNWRPLLGLLTFTLLTIFTGGFGGAVGKIGEVLTKIPFLRWAGKLLIWIQKGINWARPYLTKFFGKLWDEIWGGFERVFPDMAFRLHYLALRIGEFFTSTLPGLAKRAGNWAVGWLGTIGKMIAEAPWRLAGAIIKFGKWLGRAITGLASDFAVKVAAAVLGVMGPVIQWLHDQWDKIHGWFSDGSVPTPPGTPGPSMGDPYGSASESGATPGLAAGGSVTRGGWTDVGEHGRERLYLPRGSSVIPLPRGGDFGDALGGREIHTHVTIDGKEILHAVHRAQDDRMARR